MEIWKNVPSFPGLSVTACGKVKSNAFKTPSRRDGQPWQTRPATILKPQVNDQGYHELRLRRDGVRRCYLVHRLVCEAFHGAPEFDDATVDHINGVRGDNRAENLEWVTRSENTRRQIRDGRCAPTGEAHPLAKLKDKDAAMVPGLYADGESVRAIAKRFGVSASLIYKILSGKKRVATLDTCATEADSAAHP